MFEMTNQFQIQIDSRQRDSINQDNTRNEIRRIKRDFLASKRNARQRKQS